MLVNPINYTVEGSESPPFESLGYVQGATVAYDGILTGYDEHYTDGTRDIVWKDLTGNGNHASYRTQRPSLYYPTYYDNYVVPYMNSSYPQGYILSRDVTRVLQSLNFTAEFYLYRNSSTKDVLIGNFYSGCNETQKVMGIEMLSTNKYNLYLVSGIEFQGDTLPIQTAIHLAFAVSLSGSTITLNYYRDGVLVETKSGTVSTSWCDNTEGILQCFADSNLTSPFRGRMYAARIYPFALTAEQVAQNRAIDVARFTT